MTYSEFHATDSVNENVWNVSTIKTHQVPCTYGKLKRRKETITDATQQSARTDLRNIYYTSRPRKALQLCWCLPQFCLYDLRNGRNFNIGPWPPAPNTASDRFEGREHGQTHLSQKVGEILVELLHFIKLAKSSTALWKSFLACVQIIMNCTIPPHKLQQLPWFRPNFHQSWALH